MQVRVKEESAEFGKCGCGRSPSGYCIGLHGLTEDEWSAQKTQILHNYESKFGKIGIEKPAGEPDDEIV
jgi:CDGSH-type Zn-finger protein